MVRGRYLFSSFSWACGCVSHILIQEEYLPHVQSWHTFSLLLNSDHECGELLWQNDGECYVVVVAIFFCLFRERVDVSHILIQNVSLRYTIALFRSRIMRRSGFFHSMGTARRFHPTPAAQRLEFLGLGMLGSSTRSPSVIAIDTVLDIHYVEAFKVSIGSRLLTLAELAAARAHVKYSGGLWIVRQPIYITNRGLSSLHCTWWEYYLAPWPEIWWHLHATLKSFVRVIQFQSRAILVNEYWRWWPYLHLVNKCIERFY